MQREEDPQHHIEEIVAKEGGIVVNGVDPGTVDQPEIHHTIQNNECIFHTTLYLEMTMVRQK